MGAHIEYIKLILTTESKTSRFDLLKDTDNTLADKIYSIIKHKEC